MDDLGPLEKNAKNSGSWRRIKSNKGPLLKWSWLFSHCYTVLACPNGCLSTRSLPYLSNRPKSPRHDVISSGVSKTPPIQPTLVQKSLTSVWPNYKFFTWPRFPWNKGMSGCPFLCYLLRDEVCNLQIWQVKVAVLSESQFQVPGVPRSRGFLLFRNSALSMIGRRSP